eukprot:gene193-4168_t
MWRIAVPSLFAAAAASAAPPGVADVLPRLTELVEARGGVGASDARVLWRLQWGGDLDDALQRRYGGDLRALLRDAAAIPGAGFELQDDEHGLRLLPAVVPATAVRDVSVVHGAGVASLIDVGWPAPDRAQLLSGAFTVTPRHSLVTDYAELPRWFALARGLHRRGIASCDPDWIAPAAGRAHSAYRCNLRGLRREGVEAAHFLNLLRRDEA